MDGQFDDLDDYSDEYLGDVPEETADLDLEEDPELNLEVPKDIISAKLEEHYDQIYQAAFEEDYDDDDFDEAWERSEKSKSEALKISKGSNVEKSSLQPSEKALLHKYEHKVNLDKIEHGASTKSSNIAVKDKADRATVENVLDPRTRAIIFKFLRNDTISVVNGCISTGKEANVYHCSTKDPNVHVALKIYKTSILVFKDRTSYTLGEFRFRRGYKGKNPRKMVTAWAEKEVRNLNRIYNTGKIFCPKPIMQKNNCLLMSFIGDGETPAPRLKDAYGLSVKTWGKLYLQTMKFVRIMFQECRLVHADLSEYNMLYFNENVYIIDVSQSVEHDHPNALVVLVGIFSDDNLSLMTESDDMFLHFFLHPQIVHFL